jgi:hypothetical protein
MVDLCSVFGTEERQNPSIGCLLNAKKDCICSVSGYFKKLVPFLEHSYENRVAIRVLCEI